MADCRPWIHRVMVLCFCQFMLGRIGISNSLWTLFFLWHPKLVPGSGIVIHFIPLGSELLIGLRTSPELFPFICNMWWNLYCLAPQEPWFLCVPCTEKQKRDGKNGIELTVHLSLRFWIAFAWQWGFSAFLEMMVVSMWCRCVYIMSIKSAGDFQRTKQKIPKETRIYQRTPLNILGRMTEFIHLLVYSTKIYWAPLSCQELYYVLGRQQQTKQIKNPFIHGTDILVGSQIL